MFPLPAATITTSLPHDVPVAESFTLPQHGPIDTPWLTEELKYFETCLLVLDVLESFGTHISKDPASPSGRWAGKPKFLGHVYHWVRKNEPIQLTMPAFPCKSANRENKVLGHLPDLGEELGMSRLNDIAVAIKNVYQPGALVNIASDGILFNDIIGVSDEETWEYSEELRAIAKEKKLDYIVFLYPQVLIGMMPASEMTREKYISTADECRALLEAQHGSTLKEIEALIKSDSDTNSTYCGMVKFLQTELFGALAGKSYRERQKLQKNSAKKMMQRSEAFTLAIRTNRSLDVRLSMHPSSGVAKLSVALVPSPKGFFQRSPWHSCVAIDSEGGYHCVHSEEVRETHELMYKDNRPYFFIAKDAVQVDKPETVTVVEAANAEAVVEKSEVPAAPPATAAPAKAELVPVVEKEEIVTVVENPVPTVIEKQEAVMTFTKEQVIATTTEIQETATFIEEQPIATIPEKQEDVTVIEGQPIATIAEKKEVATIAQEQPSATTTEEKEAETFIEEKSIATFTEKQEIITIVEEQTTVTSNSQDAATAPDSKQNVVEADAEIPTADPKLPSNMLDGESFPSAAVLA
ncbi:Isocyanide synthase xanB [Metarhizium brunneum]|uniref:Isocyanide synthase xanB n=1 Tax=Metarhizium brunneum TaxID=500148 RepID=A0A7D5Z8K8_9HYPO